jgi:hypothetical protein
MTSGEAAMHAINKNNLEKIFSFRATKRYSIFEKVKENKTTLENVILFYAQVYLMNHEKDLDYYKNFLKNIFQKN